MATIIGNTLAQTFPLNLQGARFEQNDSSPLFPVGTVADDSQGGQWIYVKSTAAIAQYDLCWVDETGFVALTMLNATTPAAGRPVILGIAQVAFPTGTTYGWLWRGPGGGVGVGLKVNALISCVKDVALYATATAGKVDDAATTNYKIGGFTLTATEPGTGTTAIECYASLPLSLVQVNT